jgi:L-fuculose-phosphate aldolase
MPIPFENERSQVVQFSLKMSKDGLTRGTLGNISVLVADNFMAVTPSGVDYDEMTPEDVPIVDFDNNLIEGRLQPSSECPMHIAIYKRKADARAIVHTHSPYATAFSIVGQPIPAIHYVVGRLGGAEIPLTAEYQLFGSDPLADQAVEALGDRYTGVLLRNHGAIAIGKNLSTAYSGALNIESMAELAYLAKGLGTARVLSETDIDQAIAQFSRFGKKRV